MTGLHVLPLLLTQFAEVFRAGLPPLGQLLRWKRVYVRFGRPIHAFVQRVNDRHVRHSVIGQPHNVQPRCVRREDAQ